MIEAGVLRNPDVDAIVGLHLWNNLPYHRESKKLTHLTIFNVRKSYLFLRALWMKATLQTNISNLTFI
jgi:hypothetical protein